MFVFGIFASPKDPNFSWYRLICTYVARKATATSLANQVFTRLYLQPLWIPGHIARSIASQWENFLVLHQRMAAQAIAENRLLFLFNAKAHMQAHTVKGMHWECDLASFVLNPLSLGCQLEEDCVGKICRLVRRCNPQTAIRRSFQRYLVACQAAWSAEGMLQTI